MLTIPPRDPWRWLAGLAILLTLAIALTLQLVTRPTSLRQQRLHGELSLELWLSELAADLAQSSEARLFPNRCELIQTRQSELRRPLGGLVLLSSPLNSNGGDLQVMDASSGQSLSFRALGPRQLTVESAEPVRIQYPVDQLTVYLVTPESGAFEVERRDVSGATEVTRLNHELRVNSLGFETEGELVLIRLQVSHPSGWSLKGQRSVRSHP
ncbi:hypothetical protein DYH09_10265 [bacterium CPR1]|nr:hypothetical protein [bacterium CPR1]